MLTPITANSILTLLIRERLFPISYMLYIHTDKKADVCKFPIMSMVLAMCSYSLTGQTLTLLMCSCMLMMMLMWNQWFSIVQWFSMVPSGSHAMVPSGSNGSQWFSMVPNGSNGSQRFSMLSSDFIVVPSGSQWQSVIPVVLNGF